VLHRAILTVRTEPARPNLDQESMTGANACTPIHRALHTGAMIGLLAVLTTATAAARGIAFGPEEIITWRPHAFAGVTDYRLLEVDGRLAVAATCTDGAASGLFYRPDVDLRKTPIVEWEWRVDETLAGVDETTRRGDDYPARLYIVDEAPILRWRTRALNYVWSSTSARGSDWPNAFAAQARMIAVASAEEAGTGWRTERRNVAEDFRRFHDREPERISAVAVMTDCDNTGRETRAFYGTIRFLPE